MPPHVDKQELAEQARAEGVELLGPGGLLTGLTSRVINSALEVEMTDHLGYDEHDPAGRNGANSWNGIRTNLVLSRNAATLEGWTYGSACPAVRMDLLRILF